MSDTLVYTYLKGKSTHLKDKTFKNVKVTILIFLLNMAVFIIND